MSKVKFLLLMIIFVIFSLIDGSSTVLADVGAEAENAINVAHATIIECYEAAAKAQEAGANITRLLDELNMAGEIYSKAVLAYRSGDYDLAIDLAGECSSMLENFVSKANDLREEAAERSRWDFMVNFVGSIVGSVSVIAVSFSLWTLFKRKRIFRGRKIRIEDYRAVFLVVTFIVALIVASPALSRLLVYPRTEFFTELWILDSNHRAENYPFNITRNQNYTIYLGIGNHLGNCSYYVIEVKFKNQ
nr:DUF1616 domain-containing protein [Candidatus Baldrarchaeota archaeon]